MSKADPQRNHPCLVDGCSSAAFARGWCRRHYGRWYRNGDPVAWVRKVGKSPCSIDGCMRPLEGYGLCNGHLTNQRKYGHPTAGEGLRSVGCAICYRPDVDEVEDQLRRSGRRVKRLAEALGVHAYVLRGHMDLHMDNPEHAEKVVRYQMARLMAARTRMEQNE